MRLTNRALVEFGERLFDGRLDIDGLVDLTERHVIEFDDGLRVIRMANYSAAYAEEQRRSANRKARALFRSLLTSEQFAAYRRNRSVVITGSAGGRYRIQPTYSVTTLALERHGKAEIAVDSFCLHDEANRLPYADIAAAHMLWLLVDEPGFLRAANRHPLPNMRVWGVANPGWSGDWQRRLRGRRQQEVAA